MFDCPVRLEVVGSRYTYRADDCKGALRGMAEPSVSLPKGPPRAA